MLIIRIKEKLIKNYIIRDIIKKVDNKNIKNLTFNIKNNDIGKCIYVDYHRRNFITKYNDIYNFLKNNQFVPEKYNLEQNKGNKKIAKKRTEFRKQCRKNYFISEDRLYYKYKRNNSNIINCKIPYKEEVLALLKNIHITNHHCNYKTLCNHILNAGFYWEGYTSSVQEFLNNCELCNADKKKKLIKPPVKIILDNGPRCRYVFDIYNIPEELSKNTPYLYILDCVDHFSKYINSFLLVNKTMPLVLSKIKLFINNNGICKIIQTDNGKEFDNTQMKLFCENNNIKFIKSSPYHPQSNGSVEIIHKIECE